MPPAGNIGVFLTIFSYYDKVPFVLSWRFFWGSTFLFDYVLLPFESVLQVTFCVSGDTRLIEDTLTIVENIDKNIKDTARALGCL